MNKIKIIHNNRERIATIQDIHRDRPLINENIDIAIYCQQLGTLRNGTPIFHDDIFVSESGDLYRIWIEDGVIACGDVEKFSSDSLFHNPYRNWLYVGNYNIKSSFENNQLYIDYKKRLEEMQKRKS